MTRTARNSFRTGARVAFLALILVNIAFAGKALYESYRDYRFHDCLYGSDTVRECRR